jgi:hypothetical protein
LEASVAIAYRWIAEAGRQGYNCWCIRKPGCREIRSGWISARGAAGEIIPPAKAYFRRIYINSSREIILNAKCGAELRI